MQLAPLRPRVVAVWAAVPLLLLASAGTRADDAPGGGVGLELPIAVAALDAHHFVVADAAMQRIFRVDERGAVSSLAGSGTPDAERYVAGGYRDGPGDVARFDRPQGIAVDRTGDIYVADTGNHCIRKIDPQGNVTTFLGSPQRYGGHDGRATAVSFEVPRGLAFDGHGDLFVADAGTGVREILPDGNVLTLTMALNFASDVAVLPGPPGLDDVIVVSDNGGLVVGFPGGPGKRYPATAVQPDRSLVGAIADAKPLGFPFAVTGLDQYRVAFTDLREGTIRVLSLVDGTLRTISDRALVNESTEPLAIRAAGDAVAVTQARGKHFFTFSLPAEPRAAFHPVQSAMMPPRLDPSHLRIVHLGNSVVWWDTGWADSIAGQLERILDERLAPARADVLPVAAPGGTLSAMTAYAEFLCEAHSADEIAFALNRGVIAESFNGDPATVTAMAPTWTQPVHDALAALQRDCAADGVAVVPVINPHADELAAAENLYDKLLRGELQPADPRPHEALLRAVADLGPVDLWPAFLRAESAPDAPALFLPYDQHFTAYGRRVYAQALADDVMRRRHRP